jgi:hypothetical protein
MENKMSDTTDKGQGDASANTVDPINNVKQEFTRKLGNVESQVAELTKANQQLLAQLQNFTASKQAPVVVEENLEDLWYKDPNAAAAKIEARTEKRIEAKIAQTQRAQQKQNQTLNKLVSEYPELNDESNPLYKKAVEIYTAMDDDDKVSPTAYRLAVKEAAQELNVKPVNKRSEEELDAYSVSSSSTYSNRPQTRGKREDEVDPRTLAFAKALGRPVDDPKYLESLKKSARKQWTKYE